MKTKMIALVLTGMAVCSQVHGQQTMTINGQTVILSDMKKNGQPTTDAEAAKVLGEGLRSFGVVKPGDRVVVAGQEANTDTNRAIGNATTAGYDPEQAKHVFAEGKKCYIWRDGDIKVTKENPPFAGMGPLFTITGLSAIASPEHDGVTCGTEFTYYIKTPNGKVDKGTAFVGIPSHTISSKEKCALTLRNSFQDVSGAGIVEVTLRSGTNKISNTVAVEIDLAKVGK